jgi:hypothetical protein
MGFNGIYVDRKLYKDGSEAFETELRTTLGVEPIVSDDQRLAFFPMTQYIAALKSRIPADQWQIAREDLVAPLTADLVDFHMEEKYPTERYSWSSSEVGRLRLENPKNKPTTAEVSYSFATAHGVPAKLRVKGLNVDEEHDLPAGPSKTITHRVTVPPGKHFIEFSTDAPVMDFPQRRVVFRLRNLEVGVASPYQTALQSDVMMY